MEISREFLVNLLNIGTFTQFLAALVSSIYIKKYNNTVLKYFSILLWYTFLNEIAGILLIEYYSRFNAIIYNIYHVINFIFLFLVYREFIKNRKFKVVILIFIALYIIVFIANGYYENYLIEFQSIPYITAASFMIITIIFYFSELLNSEKVLNTNRNLLFLISVGLLIFFVGNIPFRIVKNYYADLEGITILFLINIILTIGMNIFFMIGFIWSDSKQQY